MPDNARSARHSRRGVLAGLAALPLIALVGCGRGDGPRAKAKAGTQDATASPASAGTAVNSTSSATPGTTAAATAGGLYYPPAGGEWATIAPREAGFTAVGIEAVVALARANKSATFTMLSGGRMLTENYFANATATGANIVASVQKSVTSMLVGIAREKGLLTLDDPVSKYLPAGWSRANAAHEAAITIRHLMTHSSGLNPRTLRTDAPPGTKFDYNTDAYQKLRPLLEKAAGQDYNALARAWLWNPIAVSNSTRWIPNPDGEKDATGAPQMSLEMTARDMARFGLMALRRGQWAGTSVVKPSWFDEAWTSSSVNDDYGLLWWLMGKGRVPGAPKDWVAALGARDQKVYVVPSLDLVVTRQGLSAAEESEHFSNFDTQLFRAISAART